MPARASEPDPFLRLVADTIRNHNLLQPQEKVLVAVSGGLDSTVLLHALRALGYVVEGAHFDHQTREGESAGDANFVQHMCRTLDVPCFCGTEPVLDEALRSGTPFEAYARKRRYAFLTATAALRGCRVLATGHQMDDQAETVLMGVLGLSSDFGPGGFPPLTYREQVWVIRPLIDCSRDQIERWANARDITWREDSTNASTAYTRNRMRIELIPLIKSLHPGFGRRLARFGEMLRSDTQFLDLHASRLLQDSLHPYPGNPDIFELDHRAFLLAPEALRRHALKVLACRHNVRPSYGQFLRADIFVRTAPTGRYFDFGGGIKLYKATSGVHILVPSQTSAMHRIEATGLNIPGSTIAGVWTLDVHILEGQDWSPATLPGISSPWHQYFDLDVLGQPVEIRSRKPGDRIVPYGMHRPRKIQDIMVECGIPEYHRDALPVLTTPAGILWVPGCRRAAMAPILETTRRVLEVECRFAREECG